MIVGLVEAVALSVAPVGERGDHAGRGGVIRAGGVVDGREPHGIVRERRVDSVPRESRDEAIGRIPGVAGVEGACCLPNSGEPIAKVTFLHDGPATGIRDAARPARHVVGVGSGLPV